MKNDYLIFYFIPYEGISTEAVYDCDSDIKLTEAVNKLMNEDNEIEILFAVRKCDMIRFEVYEKKKSLKIQAWKKQ